MEFTILALAAGFALGFAYAIPIGPVSVTVIRQTASKGFYRGASVGLGAATSDAFLCALFIIIVTAAAATRNGLLEFLGIAGGLYLIARGSIAAYRLRGESSDRHVLETSGRGSVRTRVRVASGVLDGIITNTLSPITLATWAVVAPSWFGHFGRTRVGLCALGVFVGVSAWFLIEAASVRYLSGKFEWFARRTAIVGAIATITLGLVIFARATL